MLRQFIYDFCPPVVRGQVFLEYLKYMTNQFQYLENVIDVYYDNLIYDITHSGQVLSLEHYLNNKWFYDGSGNFIKLIEHTPLFITSNISKKSFFIFSETSPNFYSEDSMILFNEVGTDFNAYNYYQFGDLQLRQDEIDFNINISPLDNAPEKVKVIKFWCDVYRNAGKTFQIIENEVYTSPVWQSQYVSGIF